MSFAWQDRADALRGTRLLQLYLQCVHGALCGSAASLSGADDMDVRKVGAAPVARRPEVAVALARSQFRGFLPKRDPVTASLDAKVSGLIGVYLRLAMLQDLRTVKPLSYNVHLTSLLMVFLWTLPPVLLGVTRGMAWQGGVVVAIEFVVAWAFTGVDAAAREAEAPMGNDANDIDVGFYLKESWESLEDIILREAEILTKLE